MFSDHEDGHAVTRLPDTVGDRIRRTEGHHLVRRDAVERHHGLAGGQIHHDPEAAAGDHEPVAVGVVRDPDRVQPVVAEVRRPGAEGEQVAVPGEQLVVGRLVVLGPVEDGTAPGLRVLRVRDLLGVPAVRRELPPAAGPDRLGQLGSVVVGEVAATASRRPTPRP